MEMHLTSALSGNSFDDLIEVLCLYKCRLCHFAVSTGKADVIVHIKTEHQQTMLGHCFPGMNSFTTRQPGNSGISTLSEALRSRHLMLQKDGLQGTSAVSIGNNLPVRWSVPPVQLSRDERLRDAVSYVTPSFEQFSHASGPAAAQRRGQSSSPIASSGRLARSALSSSASLTNCLGDGSMTVKEEPLSEGEEDTDRLDPSWGDSEGSTRIGEEEGAKGTGQTSTGIKLKKTVSIVCPICNARLYRKTVDRHMDLHNDRGGFTCDGCDFETDQWHEMRSHMQRKHKPKHRCQNCDFETWSTEVFSEHMDVCVAEEEGEGNKDRTNSSGAGHDSDSSMKVSRQDVEKEDKAQEGVLEDKETTEDEEFEICAECGEQLQGEDVTIHSELHNRGGGFSCDKCEFKTESWPEIKDHLKENHKLKCQSCNFETLSESFLDKHVCKGQQTAVATNPEATAEQFQGSAEEKTGTEKEPNTDKNVEGRNVDNTEDTETCSVCNLQLKSPSLQRHKELHDSAGGFKCDQCDFSTASWEDMEAHLASKHDSAYRCANCEFETTSEATLVEHFKSGSCTLSDRESEGDGRVVEEGGEESLADASMEDDETQDLEADDFEKYKDKLTPSGHCCVCGVRLYRKSVQRHMQLHNDEGGFSCRRCDFSTDSWKEIVKHVDWHDRVRKKYRCPNCPYSSWAKTKMQVHFRKSHSGRNTKESDHLICPLCGVKLKPSALIAHMDSEHVLSTDKATSSPGKGEDKEASPFVQCPLCQIKVHQRMLRKHLDMPHVQWPKGAFAAPVTPSPSSQGGPNVAAAAEIECPLCSKKIPSANLRKHLDEPHPQWSQNPSNVSLQVNQGLMTIMPEKKDLQVQCPLCGMCMHRNMLTKHMKMPHVRWPQGTVSCTAEDNKGENNARETALQGEGTGNNGLSSHGTASEQRDEVMVLSDDELEMDSDVFEEEDQQGSVGHCGICGEQVSDKSVERHMLLHNDKGGFSCDKCEFTTTSWREMRTHIRNVHKEKLLCPECGFLAATVDLLRAHVMNCREKTSAAVCSICGQEVPGNQLQQHVKDAHSTVTNIMDIDLPSSLPSSKGEENSTTDVSQTSQSSRGDSLIDSSPRLLPPKKRQSVAGAHDCPICGCHLYSKTVELHMRLHDAHGGFVCDLCNYITDEWRLMRTHYNSSHSGQRNWHAALKNDI